MARTVRKSGVKEVPLSEIKDDLSRYLREAETQEIIITRHGKPAGVLIGFESEEDWFDYRLEHDPRFLQRIETGAEQPARWRRNQTGGRRNGVARDCFVGACADITAANEAALRGAHEFAGVEFHPRERWRTRRAPAKAAKAEAVRTGDVFAKRTQSFELFRSLPSARNRKARTPPRASSSSTRTAAVPECAFESR